MALNERDANILTHMLAYCDDIFDAVRRFGDSFEAFRSDKAYRNACAMCILQIGELAGHLSPEFRSGHPQMPWNEIKAMRNVVAHAYGSISVQMTWMMVPKKVMITAFQKEGMISLFLKIV